MTIKEIIFDCDGVILDSNKAYEHVFEKLCKKYKVRTSRKEIYSHFGEHPKKILQELFQKDNINEVYKEYVKIIGTRNFIRHIKIIPKAKKTIIKLKKDYKLVLASGAIKKSLIPALRKFNLEKYFDFIITSDDVKISKPNPEIIIKAMKLCKTKRNETIYVGDSPNDIMAAKRAHVKIITVLTGVLNKKEAKKLKSDFIVKNIGEIYNFVKSLKI
ncbi:MAG: HAD family hydrolase [Candidatus Aenigmatarchaeota archaeon]